MSGPNYDPPPYAGEKGSTQAQYPPSGGSTAGYPPSTGQPYPQHGNPPPPAQYPPPQGNPGQQQQTVVIQQPTYVVPISFGSSPVNMTCTHCHANIVTTMSYETGTLTWLIAGALCLFGLWYGCCLIPFCVDGCKDVTHSCPNCRQILGHHRRM